MIGKTKQSLKAIANTVTAAESTEHRILTGDKAIACVACSDAATSDLVGCDVAFLRSQQQGLRMKNGEC